MVFVIMDRLRISFDFHVVGTVCGDINSHIVPTARGKRDF